MNLIETSFHFTIFQWAEMQEIDCLITQKENNLVNLHLQILQRDVNMADGTTENAISFAENWECELIETTQEKSVLLREIKIVWNDNKGFIKAAEFSRLMVSHDYERFSINELIILDNSKIKKSP